MQYYPFDDITKMQVCQYRILVQYVSDTAPPSSSTLSLQPLRLTRVRRVSLGLGLGGSNEGESVSLGISLNMAMKECLTMRVGCPPYI
jgi:hypothetical protein